MKPTIRSLTVVLILAGSGLAFGTTYFAEVNEFSIGEAYVDLYSGYSVNYATDPLFNGTPPSWVTVGYKYRSVDYEAVMQLSSWLEDRSTTGCGERIQTELYRWKRTTGGWQSAHGGTCAPTTGTWDYLNGSDIKYIDSCNWNLSDGGTDSNMPSINFSDASTYASANQPWAYVAKMWASFVHPTNPQSNRWDSAYSCFHIWWK